MKKILCLVVLITVITGCTTPVSKNLIRTIPEPVGENFGNIVLLRPAKLPAAAVAFNVFMNNYAVDRISSGTYKEYKLLPGQYTIYLQANNHSNIVQLDLKKGETVYLKAENFMGWVASSLNIYQINEDEAKNQIEKLERVDIKYK